LADRAKRQEVFMAHLLPATDSALNELFEVSDLVLIGTGILPAPAFYQAKANALRAMKADKAIAAVTAICLRANDDLEMVEFGPRGRASTLWNFTTG